MDRNQGKLWAVNYSRNLVWYLIYRISHSEYMKSWLRCTTSTVIKWNLLFWYLIQQIEKKTEEANAEGVDFCCPAKTVHNRFFLALLEKLTLWILFQELPVIDHSWESDKSTDLRSPHDLLLLRGLELLNQALTFFFLSWRLF